MNNRIPSISNILLTINTLFCLINPYLFFAKKKNKSTIFTHAYFYIVFFLVGQGAVRDPKVQKKKKTVRRWISEKFANIKKIFTGRMTSKKRN